MNSINRLRLEKAATDCGFEMTPLILADGLELRSAKFPETVTVRQIAPAAFSVSTSNIALLGVAPQLGSMTVDSYDNLYEVLKTVSAQARTLPNRIADVFRTKVARLPQSTEAERLVVQRVGQELFRDSLLDYWQGRCSVTGLTVPPLLRASHIKPWAKCETDNERLDVFNGLLLAPHIDALFDGGWISFTDQGAVIVSDFLPSSAREQLGVTDSWRIRNLASGHVPYLEFHRKNELRRSR